MPCRAAVRQARRWRLPSRHAAFGDDEGRKWMRSFLSFDVVDGGVSRAGPVDALSVANSGPLAGGSLLIRATVSAKAVCRR